MPWFPDFASAVELARRQTRTAGQANPVAQYFAALNSGDAHALETVWPGDVVIHDPRAGEVRGHKQLQRFVSQNQSWLAVRHARIETVASTCVRGRAVVELLARPGSTTTSSRPSSNIEERVPRRHDGSPRDQLVRHRAGARPAKDLRPLEAGTRHSRGWT